MSSLPPSKLREDKPLLNGILEKSPGCTAPLCDRKKGTPKKVHSTCSDKNHDMLSSAAM